MMMKRKRSSSKEAMERTEFSKDATRLLKEFQYLGTDREFSCLSSAALHQPSPVHPCWLCHKAPFRHCPHFLSRVG